MAELEHKQKVEVRIDALPPRWPHDAGQLRLDVRPNVKTANASALLTLVVFGIVYSACCVWFPGSIAPFILLTLAMGGIPLIRAGLRGDPYTILAGPDGMTVKRWGRTLWKIAWEDIDSTAPTSSLNGTVICGRDGIQRTLPLLLTPDATFTTERNNLRRLVERMGLASGYSRATPESPDLVRRPLAPKMLLTLGATLLISSIAFYTFTTVTFVPTYPHPLSDGQKVLAFLVMSAMTTGLYTCIWGLIAKYQQDPGLRWRMWKASLLQLGLRQSLYRQLMQTSKPAYGLYRYPEDFTKLEPEDQKAFDLNWPWGPSAFAVLRELYWSPTGLSFTPGGPICSYKSNGYENEVQMDCRVLITVTDGEQTATFDPRYLNLVRPE